MDEMLKNKIPELLEITNKFGTYFHELSIRSNNYQEDIISKFLEIDPSFNAEKLNDYFLTLYLILKKNLEKSI